MDLCNVLRAGEALDLRTINVKIKQMAIDTTKKYIEDPENPGASKPNPAYVAPTKIVSTLKDYYSGLGQSLPTIEERAKTYESLGLGSAKDYIGKDTQNISLLSKLQGGQAPKTIEQKTLGSLGNASGVDTTGANVGTGTGTGVGGNLGTGATDRTTLLKEYRDKLGLGDLETKIAEGITTTPSKESIYAEKSAGIAESKSNLKSLDERLLEMKNALDASAEDIRKRTIASGGVVTESQTQRLLASEKAPLLDAYNRLTDSRNILAKTISDAETEATAATERAYTDKTAAQTALQAKYTFLKGLSDEQYAVAEKDLADKLAKATAEAEAKKGVVVGSPIVDDYGNVSIIVQNADGSFTTKTMGALGATKTPSKKTEKASTTEQVAALDQNISDIDNMIYSTDAEGNKTTNAGLELSSKLGIGPGAINWLGTQVQAASASRNPDIINFIGSVEKMLTTGTLKALIDAKAQGATFGALSDRELATLAQSFSKIGTWRTEADGKVIGYNTSPELMKAELERIKAHSEELKKTLLKETGATGAETITEKRVTVKDASGNQYTVPESQLEEAKAQGYTPL